MKALHLTKDVLDALQTFTPPGGRWRDTSRPLPNGLYEILVDDATDTTLRLLRLRGESDSDLILRLVQNQKTNGLIQ